MSDPVVAEDHWENYVGKHNANPVFVSYDKTAGQKELFQRLVYCARIMIPVHAPNRNGGPSEPESGRLWNMEDKLCESLVKQHVDCRLVGRLTYQGIRELVFQLSDWEYFRPVVGNWMLLNQDYEIEVSEHEGWEFVRGSVWPSAFTPINP